LSPRLAINILKKDWYEYKRPILMLTAGMFAPLLFTQNSSSDFSKGLMGGILIAGSYGYAYFCFASERQRGTLQLLQSLPVRSLDLVLAKYASLYSMSLFTVNLPGAWLKDIRLLYLMNASVVLLATISMAATVVSDKSWAPTIPMWVVVVGFIPIRASLDKLKPNGLGLLDGLSRHPMLFATAALCLAPVIAVLSALYFEKKFSYID
jgi:hypothetical protein